MMIGRLALWRDGFIWDDEYHLFWWNLLRRENRYWGYIQGWHDGPLSSFGWWYGNISWRLPWT